MTRFFTGGAHVAVLMVAGIGSCERLQAAEDAKSDSAWKMGTPIVTYWAGPAMTDAVAQQMADGGWNVVWCPEKELDVAQRHGLRAQLQDGLLSPASLVDAVQREKLDALIARVSTHPVLYSYFITDEPSAAGFPALGKLVAYLHQRDPAHLAYINLFPTYANNEQLGTAGDTVTAYREHLRQYVEVVRPSLISYDHYQFSKEGDMGQYFLNLAMIRRAAQDAEVPFLNIVQACTWTPSMRVPSADEMRYLVNTSLAYGAQGISYYVYCAANHTGGIAHTDGTPTPIYPVLKSLNRQFVAIASASGFITRCGETIWIPLRLHCARSYTTLRSRRNGNWPAPDSRGRRMRKSRPWSSWSNGQLGCWARLNHGLPVRAWAQWWKMEHWLARPSGKCRSALRERRGGRRPAARA